MNAITTTTQHIQMMKDIRDTQGIRALLIYMNGLTHHRFTALYRFAGEQLENLYFYDREEPDVQSTATIPVMASYCVFVRKSAEPFMTSDSLVDDRVIDHPKRI